MTSTKPKAPLTEEAARNQIRLLKGSIIEQQEQIEGNLWIRGDALHEIVVGIVGDISASHGQKPMKAKTLNNLLVKSRDDLGIVTGQFNPTVVRGPGYLFYRVDTILPISADVIYRAIRDGVPYDYLRQSFEGFLTKKPEPSVVQPAPVPAPVVAVVPPAEPDNVVPLKQSLRSLIERRWPVSKPYVDELVKRAVKILGDRVVMNGTTRCAQVEDFNALVLPLLADPLVHRNARDANAQIIANTQKRTIEFNPPGLPLVTRDSLVFLPEDGFLTTASQIAQEHEDYERANAALRDELASLRQALMQSWSGSAKGAAA